MAPRTRLFYDSEFTGLHQHTTLISMGLCAANGEEFYAEFADYAAAQCDGWIRANVLAHTRWLSGGDPAARYQGREGRLTLCCGDSAFIRDQLALWLKQFGRIEIWGDCPAYDWVLFCELFGGALRVPPNVFYMPHDLATLFAAKGLDPDTSRAEFSGLLGQGKNDAPHNALWDARLIQACHRKLTQS